MLIYFFAHSYMHMFIIEFNEPILSCRFMICSIQQHMANIATVTAFPIVQVLSSSHHHCPTSLLSAALEDYVFCTCPVAVTLPYADIALKEGRVFFGSRFEGTVQHGGDILVAGAWGTGHTAPAVRKLMLSSVSHFIPTGTSAQATGLTIFKVYRLTSTNSI